MKKTYLYLFHVLNLLSSLRLWVVWGFIVLLTIPEIEGAEELKTSPPLSIDDIYKAAGFVLSADTMNFEERVESAARITISFEKLNRPKDALNFCLNFYSEIKLELQSATQAIPLPDQFVRFAQQIDQGKLKLTAQQLDEYLKTNLTPEHPAPSVFSLLALKSDQMAITYFTLFSDFSSRKLTPYGIYVLGYLSAREKRFLEAEHLMEQAEGKMGSPVLERWLKYDLTRVRIFNPDKVETTASQKRMEQIQQDIHAMLKSNPNDSAFLFLSALYNSLNNNNKDQARRQLILMERSLHPDPYLISEAVQLAINLNLLDLANRILEKFESQVDPVSEFYRTFRILRLSQGRTTEAQKYLQKEMELENVRVSSAGVLIPTDKLQNLLTDARKQQRKEIASYGAEPLNEMYLHLLREDAESAVALLKEQITKKNSTPLEYYLLATIHRRAGLLQEAYQNYLELRKRFPDFQAYTVLSLLADLSVRNRDFNHARQYYQELSERFPESYQGSVARKFLANREPVSSVQFYITSSVLMSRFNHYNAPFVMSEIMNHWGDYASFSTVNGLLGTSKERGLRFNEFILKLDIHTRYKIEPFVGTRQTVLECLRQEIPVIYIQADLFATHPNQRSIVNQFMHDLLLITGADPARGILYAEGVTPYDKHLLTEQEILQGICFAVYPETWEPEFSAEAKEALKAGLEYIQLNNDAIKKRRLTSYEALEFIKRSQTVLEEGNLFLPHKLAFARWMQENTSTPEASDYLDKISKAGDKTTDFWLLRTVVQHQNKQTQEAIQSILKAEKMNPATPRFSLEHATIFANTGKIMEAIEIAENLRYQYPEDLNVSAHLWSYYKKADNQKESEDEMARIQKFYPDVEFTEVRETRKLSENVKQ